MGLFDAIASQAVGALTQAAATHTSAAAQPASPDLMGAVMGLIGGVQGGGIAGLVSAFQAQGLGSIIASWMGGGEHLPVSAQQLLAVLGNEQVQAIAHKLGLPPLDASQAMASLLPSVISSLAPSLAANGTLPAGGDLLSQGLSMLGGFGHKG
ncbi:YidB family protein [Leptothrix ochracea]|uniref:YidB family protein n=1 Tax=Leptothrix ochracea TaxID=735331 RepID=UPI0034E1B142